MKKSATAFLGGGRPKKKKAINFLGRKKRKEVFVRREKERKKGGLMQPCRT